MKAAGQLGLPPRRCVVFEDAPAGVAGAKSGGMRCLAVLITHLPTDLQQADWIVNQLTDLSPTQILAHCANEAQLTPHTGGSAPDGLL